MSITKAHELIEEFEKRGFHYSKDTVFNYYLSLITKPFVILTGISGSGKSKIAEVFADIVKEDESKNYELIPVKPNWRDSRGLFGYHNLIDGSYYTTPLIMLFIRALSDKGNPYFLILDEMNIARTEHYFADYLSLIESRRTEQGKLGDTLADLSSAYSYPAGTSLSEAIILSAIDINKPGTKLKVEDYRKNRFSVLWENTIFKGNNWTAQYRSELNQGDGRLAHRVFDGGNGEYVLKDKSLLSADDLTKVESLEALYDSIVNRTYSISQDNMVLHNESKCIDSNGNSCDCHNCPFATNEKYKCNKLYDKATEHYYIPPEMPIPENVFTIGTVNIDETTYMFSPKVLDRSNVIEFNEVDFSGLYNLSDEISSKLESVKQTVSDSEFFFDDDADMPSIKVIMPSKENANRFSSDASEQFKDLIEIFIILKKHGMHFGYRVMNEVSLYMCNAMNNTSYSRRETVAFDNQLLQKILPKMYGSFDKLWIPLAEIAQSILKSPVDILSSDPDLFIENLKSISSGEIDSLRLSADMSEKYFKYPKSALKIFEMLNGLYMSGFTTFIK